VPVLDQLEPVGANEEKRQQRSVHGVATQRLGDPVLQEAGLGSPVRASCTDWGARSASSACSASAAAKGCRSWRARCVTSGIIAVDEDRKLRHLAPLPALRQRLAETCSVIAPCHRYTRDESGDAWSRRRNQRVRARTPHVRALSG
jgi:hypothetical protein